MGGGVRPNRQRQADVWWRILTDFFGFEQSSKWSGYIIANPAFVATGYHEQEHLGVRPYRALDVERKAINRCKMKLRFGNRQDLSDVMIPAESRFAFPHKNQIQFPERMKMVRLCERTQQAKTKCLEEAIGINSREFGHLPPWAFPAHGPTLRFDQSQRLKYYDLIHVVLGRVEPRGTYRHAWSHNLSIALDDELSFISFTAQHADLEDATRRAFGRNELFQLLS